MALSKEVVIEYKGKLPSVNHMYGRNPWGSVYLKPEGKALKDHIFWMTKHKMPRDTELGYELVVRGSWYNQSKTSKTRIKKRDANNLIKLIVDACCEALEIDDSQIFKESVVKQNSDNEGFSIRFYTLNTNEIQN